MLCPQKTNSIVVPKLHKRKLSAGRVELAGNGCREGMNGGPESSVLATETRAEIRVCVCDGESSAGESKLCSCVYVAFGLMPKICCWRQERHKT